MNSQKLFFVQSLNFSFLHFFRYSLTILLTSLLLGDSSQASSLNQDPTFRCENGNLIPLTKHNDGVDDCGDESDEYTEPLLFYTVRHPTESSDPIMRGFFLRTDSTFRSQLTTSCNQPLTLLAAHGKYVYLMCPGQHDHLIQMWRNGSLVQDISRSGREIQALIFDEVTSNAYLLENRRIKLCDKDFVFCTLLHGKLRHKPISLTFSSKEGRLFWIEEKSETEKFIVSARRDGTEPKIILPVDNTDPFEFVTIDRTNHRLYWLANITKNIYSSLFDGSDKKLHGLGLTNVHTFAVDKGRIFWPDQVKSEAKTCDTEASTRARCNAIRYKSDLSQNMIGNNIIIYRGERKFPKERWEIEEEEVNVEKICERSTCSHLCTFLWKTDHTCFCDTETDVPNLHNGFCEGVSLLVTRGNHLHIVGFKNKLINQNYSPILRRTTLKSIDSISVVAYDSIRGRALFAEKGKQNIYALTLGQSEPELIVEEGQGMIRTLEFDEVGNNIYYLNWCTPRNSTLRVTSCITNKTVDLLPRNTSYNIYDFTLDPIKGYIFILSETGDEINLERLSMSGDEGTRQLLHRFQRTNTTLLSLNYMRGKDILILMDRLNNEIKYAEMKKYGPYNNGIVQFKYLIDNDFNTMESVTSLQGYVIWTEADSSFRTVEMSTRDRERIALNLPVTDGSFKDVINIAGVNPAQESTHSGCRIENGGCQDLCLVSNATSLVCRCSSELCGKTNKEYKTSTLSRSTQNSTKEDVQFMKEEDNFEFDLEPKRSTRSTSTSIVAYLQLMWLALIAAIISALIYRIAKKKEKFNVPEPVSTVSSVLNMALIPEEN